MKNPKIVIIAYNKSKKTIYLKMKNKKNIIAFYLT